MCTHQELPSKMQSSFRKFKCFIDDIMKNHWCNFFSFSTIFHRVYWNRSHYRYGWAPTSPFPSQNRPRAGRSKHDSRVSFLVTKSGCFSNILAYVASNLALQRVSCFSESPSWARFDWTLQYWNAAKLVSLLLLISHNLQNIRCDRLQVRCSWTGLGYEIWRYEQAFEDPDLQRIEEIKRSVHYKRWYRILMSIVNTPPGPRRKVSTARSGKSD